jgi:hypothetical protein
MCGSQTSPFRLQHRGINLQFSQARSLGFLGRVKIPSFVIRSQINDLSPPQLSQKMDAKQVARFFTGMWAHTGGFPALTIHRHEPPSPPSRHLGLSPPWQSVRVGPFGLMESQIQILLAQSSDKATIKALFRPTVPTGNDGSHSHLPLSRCGPPSNCDSVPPPRPTYVSVSTEVEGTGPASRRFRDHSPLFVFPTRLQKPCKKRTAWAKASAQSLDATFYAVAAKRAQDTEMPTSQMSELFTCSCVGGPCMLGTTLPMSLWETMVSIEGHFSTGSTIELPRFRSSTYLIIAIWNSFTFLSCEPQVSQSSIEPEKEASVCSS